MKPELWHYGKRTREDIEVDRMRWKTWKKTIALLTEMDEQIPPFYEETWREVQNTLAFWQTRLAIEIHRVFYNWRNYEDKTETEKYLEYLKFLFILAGGEPCGW